MQKFICISLVVEKLKTLVSMFSQSWYKRGMKLVGVSITCLSFLSQLQFRSFFKNLASHDKWQKFMVEVYFEL